MQEKSPKVNVSNESNEQILSEIKKLQYLYNANRVIRFNQTRVEKYETQSVSEHITNMTFLAFHFRRLEDPNNELDFMKVIKMILMHDLGEIETGDIIQVSKTKADSQSETLALESVIKRSPGFISGEIKDIHTEYEERITRESQFVYCIDKLEGQLSWLSPKGVEMLNEIHTSGGFDTDIAVQVHNKIIKKMDEYNFPHIKRYLEVIIEEKYKLGLMK